MGGGRRPCWFYLMLGVLVSIGLPAFATPDVQDPPIYAAPAPFSTWRLAGQIGGPTQAIAVQGSYAYVGVGLRLVVLDVSNPPTPTEVGSTTPFPDFVEDVVVSGTSAYVAAGGGGLRVVDISNPTHPAEIGFWDSPGYAEGIAVSDNIAYLADGPYGLRMVDVSDPVHPTPLGSAYDMNYAFGVAVSNDHVYIAAAGAGLLIADVSDPLDPREPGTLDTPGYAYDLAVSGSLVYIADGWGGLQIVDAADPAHPARKAALATPGQAFGVAAAGTRAYVAAAYAGLRVVDVTDPAQPSELGAAPIYRGHAADVAIAGDTAFVADRYVGLGVFDVAEPTHPIQLGAFDSFIFAEGLVVANGYAYVTALSGGLQIIDLSSPATPRVIGHVDAQPPLDPDFSEIAVSGDWAYVGTWQGFIHAIDVSDPARPAEVAVLQATGEFNGMAVQGHILYVTGRIGPFQLIDISNPAHPKLVGALDVPNAVEVAVSGAYAYLVVTGSLEEGGGLTIVDVSDPNTPVVIGHYGIIDGSDVAVAGNLVYLSTADTLNIIDVSDPAHPVNLSSLSTPGYAGKLCATGDTVYVADAMRGVAVVDVSDPRNPRLVSSIPTPGYAEEVIVSGGKVYVADATGGLAVLAPNAAAATPGPGSALPDDRGAGNLLAPADGIPRAALAALTRATAATGAPGPWSGSLAVVEDRIPAGTRDGPARVNAAECVVTSAADAGPGTLRACLAASGQGSRITFDPAVFRPAAPATIAPHSALPLLTRGYVTIDGSDAGVILDGANLSGAGNGLEIQSTGNIVRGLQIVRFPESGVSINAHDNVIGGDRSLGAGPTGQGNVLSGNAGCGVNMGQSTDNIVIGNLIGTDATGTQAFGNGSLGIFMNVDSARNRIGGLEPRDRNVVSGNALAGISMMMGSTDNRILGNYIGTDVTGTRAVGNGMFGVSMELGAFGNLVQGNLISGNHHFGIYIGDFGSDYNTVSGNLIGSDVTGTRALANLPAAIDIGGAGVGVFYNRIGGTDPSERNVISGENIGLHLNGVPGDRNLVLGNFIGADITGTRATANWYSVAVGLVHGGRYFFGGATPAEGNLIGGTVGPALRIESDHNYVAGNRIGTDASGAGPLIGEGLGGITVVAQHNTIQDNRIAYSTGAGVEVTTYAYNTLRRNAIYGSTGLGILLTEGGNLLLPAPVITTVAPKSITGTACPGCMVEVFSDAEDEGRVYEGSAVADVAGHFTFDKGYPLAGPYLTATATDPDGNTSEFSSPCTLLNRLWLPMIPKGAIHQMK